METEEARWHTEDVADEDMAPEGFVDECDGDPDEIDIATETDTETE